MIVKLISTVMAVLVGVAFLQATFGIKRAASHPISGIDHYGQEILDATIQISIVISIIDETSSVNKIRGIGLGSLVNHKGQTLLVTHNHWGEFLQDAAEVEISDASHRMLRKISGSEFISLVRYQDAGTLIIEAPDGLWRHPSARDSQIQVGDAVLVAYRQTAGGDQVTLLESVVDSIITVQGLPVYKLVSRDGHPIRNGDSGGGVWHKGELVGNMWFTEVESSPVPALFVSNESYADQSPTNKSMAAALSTDILDSLEENNETGVY